MRYAMALICVLVTLTPGWAQEWKPFEVDVTEDMANEGIRRQRAAQLEAARVAPEPPAAESLGEAWSRLERSLAQVSGARVDFAPNSIVLDVRVRIFAILSYHYMNLAFDLQPHVVAPNVIELRVVGGRERWGNREWETLQASGVSHYLSRMAEEVGAGLGGEGEVRFERAQDEAPPMLVFDFSDVSSLEGVELQDMRVADGLLTLAGRTTRESFTIEVSAQDLRRGLNETSFPELLGPGTRLDVGYANPGRLTVSSRANLPWLPKTPYSAVLALERAGPSSVRLTLEDVQIGSRGLDRFLRSRLGRRMRAWVMRKAYEVFDRAEEEINAAYERGDVDVRMSHQSGTPHVRILHLRPSGAGGVVIRPGFTLEDVVVRPDHVKIKASLASEDPTATPESRRGLMRIGD